VWFDPLPLGAIAGQRRQRHRGGEQPDQSAAPGRHFRLEMADESGAEESDPEDVKRMQDDVAEVKSPGGFAPESSVKSVREPEER